MGKIDAAHRIIKENFKKSKSWGRNIRANNNNLSIESKEIADR